MGVVNQRMLGERTADFTLFSQREPRDRAGLQTTSGSGWTMCPGKKEVPEEAALYSERSLFFWRKWFIRE